jgi:ornithine cyclodeaminase/alanine dehydrogenase-like protein (mu-crystallin family)
VSDSVHALRFLDEDAVRRHLRMDALVPAVRDALAALSAGDVVQPLRTVVPVAAHAGFLGAMPAYVGDALGAKLVTFYPGNRELHTHHAVIVLFRPETGEPAAVLDGRLITEMRTAAASAAATDALARPESRVLGILGAGVQARSHLEALRLVRRFDEVRVWSPRSAAAFAERAGAGVRAAASAETAVRDADVVLVATTSQTPVLRGAWLAPGTHVNAVGATRPDWRELDDDVVHGARLFVDSREAALRESGDVTASGQEPTEIGEVVRGTRPGRTSRDEITLFKSVGVAAEDLAAAALVYRASELRADA